MENIPVKNNSNMWEAIYKERTSGSFLKYPCEDLVVSVNRYLSSPELKGARVLDVGFGSGNNLSLLASRGFDCYGVDISKSAVEVAKERLQKEGLKAKLEVVTGSKYPFKDGFFDCVVTWHVLSYNDEEGVRRVIPELKRVLKKTGILLATFPTFKDFRIAKGKRLKNNTFIFNCPGSNQDGAMVTAAQTEEQVRDIFSAFEIMEIGYSEITVKGITNSHWLIFARNG